MGFVVCGLWFVGTSLTTGSTEDTGKEWEDIEHFAATDGVISLFASGMWWEKERE